MMVYEFRILTAAAIVPFAAGLPALRSKRRTMWAPAPWGAPIASNSAARPLALAVPSRTSILTISTLTSTMWALISEWLRASCLVAMDVSQSLHVMDIVMVPSISGTGPLWDWDTPETCPGQVPSDDLSPNDENNRGQAGTATPQQPPIWRNTRDAACPQIWRLMGTGTPSPPVPMSPSLSGGQGRDQPRNGLEYDDEGDCVPDIRKVLGRDR